MTPEEEYLGLNVSEHGVTTEIIGLLTEMDEQRLSGDFSNPVTVEPYTEVGQIATEYNRVLDKVNTEKKNLIQASDDNNHHNIVPNNKQYIIL